MNKPTNIGVVGCGYWGPNLVRNLRSVPDCRLSRICDVSEERLAHLQSIYPDLKAETKFERLLEDPEIDGIVVATPVNRHFPMAKAALEAGKHVLIEKPMAASSAQCEELMDIAAKNGLVLMVGHTFLYSAAVRKIKEIVDHHDIGEIRYISARRLNLGLFQKDISVAWDLAPHDISIILYIMQEMPLSINCRGAAHITQGIEDVSSMSLHFTKERSAIVHNSWLDPRKIRDMTIVGSERMIVYDDIAFQEKIKVFDARVERPPHYDTFAEFHYAYHYGDMYCPHIKQDEPLKTECAHFVDCIRQGIEPLTCGQNGLDVVRILEAASASAKQNGNCVELADANGSRGRARHAAESHAASANGANGSHNGHDRGLNGHDRPGNGAVVNGQGRGLNGQPKPASGRGRVLARAADRSKNGSHQP